VTVSYTGQAGYAASCSANELDVTLAVSTADGALSETLQGKLFARAVNEGKTSMDVPLTTLMGDLRSTHPAGTTGADTLFLSFEFGADTLHGTLAIFDSRASGDGAQSLGEF
jgi:hypothetical protein